MRELDVGLQRATLGHMGGHIKLGCCADGCPRPCVEDTSWCAVHLDELRSR